MVEINQPEVTITQLGGLAKDYDACVSLLFEVDSLLQEERNIFDTSVKCSFGEGAYGFFANQLHWRLDVPFNEDKSTIYKDYGAQSQSPKTPFVFQQICAMKNCAFLCLSFCFVFQ